MGSTEHKMVTVRVFGSDAPAGGCNCSDGCGSGSCGVDIPIVERPSMEEQARELANKLSQFYGMGVKVEYIDVFDQEMHVYPREMRLIVERGLPLPLVTANGEPLLAGGLPLDEIVSALESSGLVSVGQAHGAEGEAEAEVAEFE